MIATGINSDSTLSLTHSKKLANGMTLFFSPLNHLHGITFSLYIRGGWIYENVETQGITHLCEQMFHRRIGALEGQSIPQSLDCMGARLMSATYSDAAAFSVTTFPKFFDKMAQFFTGFFVNPNWTDDDLLSAKNIIYRQQEEDSVSMEELVMCRLYHVNEDTYSSLGSHDSIKNLTLQQVNDWRKMMFQPKNACLCISGNFSDAMEDALCEYFSLLESDTDSEELLTVAVPQGYGMQDETSDAVMNIEDMDLAQVMLTFDTNDEQVYPLLTNVISACTADDDDALLFRVLRQEKGMVADISSYVEDIGTLRRLIIRYDVRHDFLCQSLREVFARLHRMTVYVRPMRLDTLRMRFTDNLSLVLDDTAGMNVVMGKAFAADDLSRADLALQANIYNDLTSDDLLTGTQAIFRPENLTITVACDETRVDEDLPSLMRELRNML